MKKFGLFCLAVVLALGTLGVGYAMWYEDLFISGTVNTGDLDIGYYCGWGSCWDTEIDGKDVSYIEKQMSADGKSITFIIHNAYPCIDYYGEFCLNVQGTVPVHFGPWVIDRGNLPAGATVEVTPDMTGVQQHPPYSHQECCLHVHLDNTAVESTTYTFTVAITGYQYNESPY